MLLLDCSLYHFVVSCFVSYYIALVLKSILSDISTATPAFSLFHLHGISFSIPFIYLFKDYLFLERGEEREKAGEWNINVWLSLTCPLLGTWLATQACALTGNWTSNTLVHRPAVNPLSYTSQGPSLLVCVSLIWEGSLGGSIDNGSCFLIHSATLCVLIGAF